MDKLKWDTDFWGVEVFHLDTPEQLDINKLNSNSYLIQILVDCNDFETIKKIEDARFRFKEVKMNLQKKILNNITLDSNNFKEMTVNELNPHKEIFFDLFGNNTRYDIFPKNKVNEFYYKWLVNSILGEMDDKCIGYYINNELAGFVTFRIRGTNLTIGLLGVLPEFQGQGIAQLLLSYIEYTCYKEEVQFMNISTQGHNINALNAYIKSGFKIANIKQWYYYERGIKRNDSI